MAEKGYIMHKDDPELNCFYGAFLYGTSRRNARVFLPDEVEGKDTNPGKLVPVMWEWKNGDRMIVNE